jgi:hypothetical protein
MEEDMEHQVKIDDGIPIPQRVWQRSGPKPAERNPFDKMKIGQSFIIETKTLSAARNQCTKAKKQGLGVFFASKVIENDKEAIRVWRIE